MTNYLIFTTGRTGSTLLCDYLHQMGLGTPKWTLSKRQVPDDVSDMKAYLESKRVNGFLGASAPWDRMFWFCDRFGTSFEDLMACFSDPFCVYMDRRNKVRQAVSMVKHHKIFMHVRTDKDRRNYEEQEEALREADVPISDIRGVVRALADEKFAFEAFFEAFGIEPYRVMYEEFVEDKVAVLADIAGVLGKDTLDVTVESRYSKVASDIDEWWYSEVMKSELSIL